MGYYKDKVFRLGGSDIASLTVRFPVNAEILSFGSDGCYKAYVVFNDEAEMPGHYRKVLSGEHWCKIYDDDTMVLQVNGDTIDIFRAGEMGVLIRATGCAWVDGLHADLEKENG